MNNYIKGTEYEKQICDILNNQPNQLARLWNRIDYETLINIGYVNDNDELRQKFKNDKDENNALIDLGCDILLKNGDDYTIIQCKNYTNTITLDKLAGFYAVLYKTNLPGTIYYDGKLSKNVTFFDKNITFNKVKYNKNINLSNDEYSNERMLTLHDYQLDAVNMLHNEHRSILSLPCGLGKTNICMKIAEEYDINIIISPLCEHAEQNLTRFTSYLNVVGLLIDCNGDRDINDIVLFVKKNNKCIISTTYKSCDMIEKLLTKFKCNSFIKRTKIYIDEYHNLNVNNISDKKDNINKILNSKYPILFISATPRIYDLEDKNIDVYDLLCNQESDEKVDEKNGGENDDEEDNNIITVDDNITNIFGDVKYTYSFRDAINNKYINDYTIFIPELYDIDKLNENNNIIYDTIHHEIDLSTYNKNNTLKVQFILNGIMRFGYFKTIVYCSSIEDAKDLQRHIDKLKEYYNINLNTDIINCDISLKKRKIMIDKFKLFDGYSLLLSIRILDECVNIPECDSIYLADNCKSKIRTIQRICRANRIHKDKHNKSGIFVWCNDNDNLLNIISSLKEFDDNIEIIKNIKVISNKLKYTKQDISNNDTDVKNEEYKNNMVVGVKLYNNIEYWKQRLEEVKQYMNEYKKRPSSKDKDLYIKKIGEWLVDQQKKYKKNRYIMKNNDIRLLYEKFKEEYGEYFISKEEIWHDNLNKVKEYIHENNKVPSQNDKDIKIERLGEWLSNQSTNYKNKKNILKNDEPRLVYEQFKDEYSEYFISDEEIWYDNLNKLKEYININKKKPSKSSNDIYIKKLGKWLSSQQTNYKNNLHTMKNNDIHISYEQFKDEYSDYFISKEEIWYSNLNKCKEFININKKRPSCKSNDKETRQLGQWLVDQTKRYKKNIEIMKHSNIRLSYEQFSNEYL